MSPDNTTVIPKDALLKHWQGHRHLTRRLIETFPDDQYLTFAVGGMRPFGEMAMELLNMAEPMARGMATGEWTADWKRAPLDKPALLEEWDAATARIDELWAQIPPERFGETLNAFGQFEGVAYDLLFYAIDNEVHHRAQGYVYLRALGVEPPPFWER